jgi:acetyltransferase-like isoleucine patch superfamily enzyme
VSKGEKLFLSKRARIDGILEGEAIILGPTIIGTGTIIGDTVMIGYPARGKVIALGRKANFDKYDEVSDGSKVGKGCIIRAGSRIYEDTQLGDVVETGHGVLIREKTVIGDGTKIGTYTVIDGNVRIGSKSNIQTGVYIPPGTVIGSNVFIGPYVTVTNDRYPPSPKISGVIIEDEVVVGSRAVLIAGVRVGEGSVIGAGAVVTKDVQARTVVLGVPAKVIMSREEYNRKQREYLSLQ